MVTLYRPVGPTELALIEASGWREFPPRLPEQPIFYPVTNEAYAIQIARDWNVKESGSGHVTRFDVDATYLNRYRKEQVGAQYTPSIGSPPRNFLSLIGTLSARSLSRWSSVSCLDSRHSSQSAMGRLRPFECLRFIDTF